MKKIIWMVILALIFGLVSSVALAQSQPDSRELAYTPERRVDLLGYTASGIDLASDFVTGLIERLFKTGKPGVVFAEETKATLEASIIEGMLGSNVDLIGGMTLRNDEPSNFVWGFQYTGLRGKAEKSGGIWLIFKDLNPAVYNERGHWWFGGAYTWRE